MPYTKQNANTKYDSTSSSYPPTLKRSIPEGVSRRLYNISSSKKLFLQEAPYYQTAIKKAGHKDKLEYCPMNTVEEQAKPTRNRCRKAIWFNPPWSNNVRTNIGEKFIQLVKKHFPKSSPMHHIFNTKNLKVSYKTTTNMASTIKGHNSRTICGDIQPEDTRGYNCHGGVTTCPLNGKCMEKSLIYRAEVTSAEGRRHYYRQTARTFKERYYGHHHDLQHAGKSESTSLSTYVWKLREKEVEPTVSWHKVCSAKPYKLGGKMCSLCLAEKTEIARDTSGEMLNKRSELMHKCLHKQKFKLDNFCVNQHVPVPVVDDVPVPDEVVAVGEGNLVGIEDPPDLADGESNLVPPLSLTVPVVVQQNLVDGQGTHDVPDSDEVVAVGEGNLGGIEDPPDLDGTLIPVNSNVRKSTRNAKRRFNCLNEENLSEI